MESQKLKLFGGLTTNVPLEKPGHKSLSVMSTLEQ